MSYPADEDEGLRVKSRQSRRAQVTLIIVMALLAGALYYASSYWRQTDPSNKPIAGSCTPGAGATTTGLVPSAITVNVYNAAGRNGLAKATGKSITAMGFKLGKVANDPLGRSVAGVGEIRFGPAGGDNAKFLQKYLPGSTLVPDQRKDETVDLVVGRKFSKLVNIPAPKPAAKPSTGASASC